jgi:hypothetical protein
VLQRRLDSIVRQLNRLDARLSRWAARIGACLAIVALSGCATVSKIKDEPHLDVVQGVDEGRVKAWMAFCEAKSGLKWEYQKIAVRAVKRDTVAWSRHFQREVGTLASGNVGEFRGGRDTASIVLAIHPDGFLPDEHGIHELGHALAANRTGSTQLPAAWKSWVLGWHP